MDMKAAHNENNNKAIIEPNEMKTMPKKRYVRVRAHYRKAGRKKHLVRRHTRRVY